MMSAPIEYSVEFTTASGRVSTTTAVALTATDAVQAILTFDANPRRHRGPHFDPIVSARLKVNRSGLNAACIAVTREHARNPWDEDTERGFVLVSDAVDHARNTLRLPEADYVAGGYPVEDTGSALDTAYRIILEATQAELDALGLTGSVRVKR